MSLRIGSLFSGYGGLDLAVMDVFPGSSVAWHVEFDKAPAAVLAYHWPDVPNYGDVTAVDWCAVEPVDIITGGFPCQDLSHAGKRAGLRPGTRSGLWSHMAYAVSILKPRLVVIENVLGILSARADSDMEPCPFCLGDGSTAGLRALGAVCADLAEIGYDAQWTTVRAADAGAPHGRARVFIIASPADTDCFSGVGWDKRGEGRSESRSTQQGEPGRVGATSALDHLLPTPKASNNENRQSLDRYGPNLGMAVTDLLPTPSVADGMGGHLSRSGARSDELLLPGLVKTFSDKPLLPTPTSRDHKDSLDTRHGVTGAADLLPRAIGEMRDHATDWGPYAAAVARWEAVTGRPAPSPTEPGRTGPRLSPVFVEWMMGLPLGHVTDPAIGLSRTAALKCLGNGVVPAQAALALRLLLDIPCATAPEAAGLLPTPTPFQLGNSETPTQWLARRKDVVNRTGTHHGLPLPVAAVSIAEGKPILLSDPTASETEWGVGE